jgi:hypothetical protein
MLPNNIWKNHLNSKNYGYIYNIHKYNKVIFSFKTSLQFGFINHSKMGYINCFKWLFVNICIYNILMVNALEKYHLWEENYQTFDMVHK